MHIDTACVVLVVRYITYRAGSFFAECRRLPGVKYTLSLALVYFYWRSFLWFVFNEGFQRILN